MFLLSLCSLTHPYATAGLQVLELFEECDDDQSGVLEFPEFVSLLMMVHKKVLTLAERKGLRDKSRIRQQEVVFEMKALQLVHRAVSPHISSCVCFRITRDWCESLLVYFSLALLCSVLRRAVTKAM